MGAADIREKRWGAGQSTRAKNDGCQQKQPRCSSLCSYRWQRNDWRKTWLLWKPSPAPFLQFICVPGKERRCTSHGAQMGASHIWMWVSSSNTFNVMSQPSFILPDLQQLKIGSCCSKSSTSSSLASCSCSTGKQRKGRHDREHHPSSRKSSSLATFCSSSTTYGCKHYTSTVQKWKQKVEHPPTTQEDNFCKWKFEHHRFPKRPYTKVNRKDTAHNIHLWLGIHILPASHVCLRCYQVLDQNCHN